MKKTVKRVMTVILVAAIVAAVIPRYTEAAAPACVKRAAIQAMNESGIDVAFVVKLTKGCSGRGTAYMFFRDKGRVICDRSGQVILGKNTPARKGYHYSFYRNKDAEKRVMSWRQGGTAYRQRYTSHIECLEGACFNVFVHSYVEYKQGTVWKTCKGLSKNTDGLSMCKELARYLWSCADPDCPVVFM